MTDDELRKRFDAAVHEAAVDSAQQVAQIHRRRLVAQSFLAAMLISAVVVVAGMVIVSNSNETFARDNAVYDCRLFAKAAHSMGDFVLSDANLRNRQNRQGLGRELSQDFQKIIRHSTLQRLAIAQQQDVARVVAKWYVDARVLQGLAGTDCRSHLGG